MQLTQPWPSLAATIGNLGHGLKEWYSGNCTLTCADESAGLLQTKTGHPS